jgi:AcrR family transcriptional regulator
MTNAPSAPGEDRRIQRTREAIRAAFMDLLKEREWDQIRIQDICDKANVGRSTFYNHYVDKEGLLSGGLSELGAYVKARYGSRHDAPDLWFARGLFDHVLENEEMFRTMQGSQSGAVVKDRFCQLANVLARDCLASKGLKNPRLDAGAAFLGGAFIELLGWYVNARKRPSVDGLEAMFHQMGSAVLAAQD